MTLFIHITDEKNAKNIQKNGIKLKDGNIYAVPYTENYHFNHQWCRELKRRKNYIPVAVLFSVDKEKEIIIYPHYAKAWEWQAIEAGKAYEFIKKENFPQGFQAILNFSIPASDIKKIYHLPKAIGWRFYPGSNGDTPKSSFQEGEPFRKKIDRLAKKKK